MDTGLRALGDMVRDVIQEKWTPCWIQQKLFGNIPELERFLELTQGEIVVKPQLNLVAPLTASFYPFEFAVQYEANPNGILVPVFGKKLKHYEMGERITESEFDVLETAEINARLGDLGRSRRARMRMSYSRDAVVDFKEY